MTQAKCGCGKRISSHTYEEGVVCSPSWLASVAKKKAGSDYVEAYLEDSMLTEREIREEV